MKRFLCVMLALLCLAGLLAGCGKKKDKDSTTSSQLTSSAATPSQAPTPEPMAWVADVTAEDGLNVRSGPSTDAEVLGLAADGSTLPLLKETPSNDWYQVEYEGETAYVYAEYVKPRQVTQSEYDALRAGKEEDGSATGAGRGDIPEAPGSATSTAPSGGEPTSAPTSPEGETPTPTPPSVNAAQDGE